MALRMTAEGLRKHLAMIHGRAKTATVIGTAIGIVTVIATMIETGTMTGIATAIVIGIRRRTKVSRVTATLLRRATRVRLRRHRMIPIERLIPIVISLAITRL